MAVLWLWKHRARFRDAGQAVGLDRERKRRDGPGTLGKSILSQEKNVA
jgi:hypothetical protein